MRAGGRADRVRRGHLRSCSKTNLSRSSGCLCKLSAACELWSWPRRRLNRSNSGLSATRKRPRKSFCRSPSQSCYGFLTLYLCLVGILAPAAVNRIATKRESFLFISSPLAKGVYDLGLHSPTAYKFALSLHQRKPRAISGPLQSAP